MSLTEAEAREAYDELSGYLRDAHLSWVLQQVAERIAYGKEVTLKESDLRRRAGRTGPLVVSVVGERSRDRSKQLTRTEPFTPVERLRILAHAISSVVVDVGAIENELLTFAGPARTEGVVFEHDAEQTDSTLRVSRKLVDGRAEKVAKLKALLAEVLGATEDAA
jgi:hypothetical protein